MDSLYESVNQQKKKNSGILRYCLDCFNNPISWIIGPTLVGYAAILTGAMQTGSEVQNVFASGQNYQDSLYKLGQTLAGKVFTPESFAGFAGFFLGGKIWRFIRGDKK